MQRTLALVAICMFWSMAFDCGQTTSDNRANKAAVKPRIQNCEADSANLKASTHDTMAWDNKDNTIYYATGWTPSSPFKTAAPYKIPAADVSSPLDLRDSVVGACSNANGKGCYYYYKLQKPDNSYCNDDSGAPLLFPMHVKG